MALPRGWAPTHPPLPNPQRSMVLGDWGGASKAPYTTSVQLDTAKAMGTVGAAFLPKLIYGVGDNLCV